MASYSFNLKKPSQFTSSVYLRWEINYISRYILFFLFLPRTALGAGGAVLESDINQSQWEIRDGNEEQKTTLNVSNDELCSESIRSNVSCPIKMPIIYTYFSVRLISGFLVNQRPAPQNLHYSADYLSSSINLICEPLGNNNS